MGTLTGIKEALGEQRLVSRIFALALCLAPALPVCCRKELPPFSGALILVADARGPRSPCCQLWWPVGLYLQAAPDSSQQRKSLPSAPAPEAQQDTADQGAPSFCKEAYLLMNELSLSGRDRLAGPGAFVFRSFRFGTHSEAPELLQRDVIFVLSLCRATAHEDLRNELHIWSLGFCDCCQGDTGHLQIARL